MSVSFPAWEDEVWSFRIHQILLALDFIEEVGRSSEVNNHFSGFQHRTIRNACYRAFRWWR